LLSNGLLDDNAFYHHKGGDVKRENKDSTEWNKTEYGGPYSRGTPPDFTGSGSGDQERRSVDSLLRSGLPRGNLLDRVPNKRAARTKPSAAEDGVFERIASGAEECQKGLGRCYQSPQSGDVRGQINSSNFFSGADRQNTRGQETGCDDAIWAPPPARVKEDSEEAPKRPAARGTDEVQILEGRWKSRRNRRKKDARAVEAAPLAIWFRHQGIRLHATNVLHGCFCD